MITRRLCCRSTWTLAGVDLALLVLAVYLLSAQPGVLAMGATATTSPPVAQPDGSAMIDTAIGPIERYRVVVERPLFDASRRPPLPDAEPERAQSEVPQTPPQFVLEGVVLAPEQRSAIFRNKTTSKALRAAEGAHIGEWTVETLEPQRVVLKHRNTAHEITLRRFDATPPTGGGVHPATRNPRGSTR